MWSILAEAVEIEREARRRYPYPLPDELIDRRTVLRAAARELGIDLDQEVRWLPHEDMTAEQATDELASITAQLDALRRQQAVLRKRDLPLGRAIADFTAYRDRLTELLQDLELTGAS